MNQEIQKVFLADFECSFGCLNTRQTLCTEERIKLRQKKWGNVPDDAEDIWT